MSGNSFRSGFMVASCAGAALGCYLVSLRVASERAALEQVETEIVLAERDIRLLQTEIGTRGRLAQLERWNVKVLALSAPSADQFVGTGFELARMVAPERKPVLDAPVVLASAPADGPGPQLEGAADPAPEAEEGMPAQDLLHTASLKRTLPPAAEPKRDTPARPPVKLAQKNSVDKPPAASPKSVTTEAKLAKVDPLAPIADSKSSKPAKDSRLTP